MKRKPPYNIYKKDLKKTCTQRPSLAPLLTSKISHASLQIADTCSGNIRQKIAETYESGSEDSDETRCSSDDESSDDEEGEDTG